MQVTAHEETQKLKKMKKEEKFELTGASMINTVVVQVIAIPGFG